MKKNNIILTISFIVTFINSAFAGRWEFLNSGDTIEIVAPSAAPMSPDQLTAAQDFIVKNGYKSRLPKEAINQESSRFKYYANTPQLRTLCFVDALNNNSKAIWILRGGFGAEEVIDLLERESFSPPPKLKPIIGFSDTTPFHLLAAKWGWPTLHAPVLGLGLELFPVTQVGVNKEASLAPVFDILSGKVTKVEHTFDVIHKGLADTAQASVLGGNCALLSENSGTPLALDGKDRFVFMEDTPEDGKRFNRRLVNLTRTGVFDQAKGIIFGNMPLIGLETDTGATKEALLYFVNNTLLPRKINIPVVYSPRFGHGSYNDIMPMGTPASLNIKGDKALLEISTNGLSTNY